MFLCCRYTIMERINLCLLKLQLLKESAVDYCRTVQHTDTNKDLIYAATLPLY